MFQNEKGRSLVVLLVFALVLCVALGISRFSKVSAQDDSQPGPGMPGMPGMGGMPDGMQGGMPGMMPGMMPMGGGPASIAVADGFVYVVQGNRLVQFNAKTLKRVKSVDVMQGGPGMMPGMGRNQGNQGNPPMNRDDDGYVPSDNRSGNQGNQGNPPMNQGNN